MQTAKHEQMRHINMLIVMDCIMKYGPVSKKEIQEKTGLSWGAISNITAELVEKRIAVEAKSNESLIGRIPVKLDISSTNNLILGLDINIEGLTVVLADMKGRTIKSFREPIQEDKRDEILKQIKALVHSAIDKADVDKSSIIGMGVAMQGAVDVGKGVSVFSPHFNEWRNVPIRDILQQEFNIPVYIEHDPNCMALCERWMGKARDIQNVLFVRVSMGIGMSILIDGKVYRGGDGSAGEFGHITVNPGGPRCICGNYGCLEAYASGRSILGRINEGVKLGKTDVILSPTGEKTGLALEQAAAAARSGDVFIKSIFEDAGIYLGIGISNLVNLFNPELIITGGELLRYKDLFWDKTHEIISLKSWRNSRVNITASSFGSDSAAIGAAAVIIQDIFNGNIPDIFVNSYSR